MLRRETTLLIEMCMSASPEGRHQVLTGSHTRSCGEMNNFIASLAAGSLDGDTKANFNDQQNIGETFPAPEKYKVFTPLICAE